MIGVFSHSSLSRGDGALNDQWGDTDRLSFLGENVMEMTIAKELFLQKPPLRKLEMEAKRAEVTHPDNYDRWITNYKLDKKLVCIPGIDPLETHEAKRRFFYTVVGALYYQQHFLQMTGDEVGPWLSRLIGINSADVPSNGSEPDSSSFTNPPSYASSNFQGGYGTQPGYAPPPQPTQHFPPTPPPPPPTSAPPPVPNAPLPPQPPANGPATQVPRSVSSLVTVALINQTAAQKSFDLKWEPSPPVGPAHAPIWTVRCTSTLPLFQLNGGLISDSS
ncbi:hypothetical protein PQX77_003163 [Marasmius sp. AFHP31]|nr:hypothetical protein PQX77_003163 [Marasmius sp. AFHP31]